MIDDLEDKCFSKHIAVAGCSRVGRRSYGKGVEGAKAWKEIQQLKNGRQENQ